MEPQLILSNSPGIGYQDTLEGSSFQLENPKGRRQGATIKDHQQQGPASPSSLLVDYLLLKKKSRISKEPENKNAKELGKSWKMPARAARVCSGEKELVQKKVQVGGSDGPDLF